MLVPNLICYYLYHGEEWYEFWEIKGVMVRLKD